MSNIANIDKNFEVKSTIGKEDVVYKNVLEEPFKIYGIFYEDGKFRRIPEAVAESVSKGVLALHANCAGGRVRFKTNSPYVAIYAELENVCRAPHFALTGTAGFDLYEDINGVDRFVQIYVPPYDVKDSYESIHEFTEQRERELTINFPLYTDVKNLYVGVAKDAYIKAPEPYKIEKPVVYYGSSITQGGCAARPGTCYEAIISRRLSCDHINLGFSGVAKAEDEIAEYISNLDMSVFVYDYDHNAPTLEHLQKTHERMFKKIREKNPTLPIIFASKPKYLGDEFGDKIPRYKETREEVYNTYKKAIAAGDKNVYFVNGDELMKYAEYEGTVDVSHPTDLGFASMAKVFGDLIEKIFEKR